MLGNDPCAHASAQVPTSTLDETLAALEAVASLRWDAVSTAGDLHPAVETLIRSLVDGGPHRDVLLVALRRARQDADRTFAQRIAASSSVGAFIASECRRGRGRAVDTVELFEAYSRWCGGDPAVQRKGFGRLLRALGFESEQTSDGRCVWMDLDLGARPAYVAEVVATGRVCDLPWYRLELAGPRGVVGIVVLAVADGVDHVVRAQRTDGRGGLAVTAPMREAIRIAVNPLELVLEVAE